MFENTMFHYLDESDTKKFKEYWGTDLESMLVAGSKTSRRLQKYLPEKEYYKIRIILTALVRDFELPAVRYTSAIALTIYVISIEKDSNISEATKNIAMAEQALLVVHLMEDNDDNGNAERDLFDRNIKSITLRWNEFLTAPSEFVL